MAFSLSPDRPRLPTSTLAIAVGATTLGMLPLFLTAGLAVQIRDDVGFGAAALGALVTLSGTSAALCSFPAGALVDRIGPRGGLVVAAAVGGTALAGIGLVSRTWWHLAVFLVVAGVGAAFAHVAANLHLARNVPVERQGLAFGVKQTAVPLATLLAGLSVPLVGLTVGWRWAFVGGVVGAAVIGAAARGLPSPVRPPAGRGRPRGPGVVRPTVLALVTTGFFGGAAMNVTGAFLVQGGVAVGLAPGAAGLVLALGSAGGVATRLVSGAWTDRSARDPLPTVAVLMVGGVGGLLVLATASGPAVFVAGGMLAFTLGWGWNGLLNYAAVLRNRHAPGTASGLLQAALHIGGAAGPLVFGFMVEQRSWSQAWLVTAAWMGLGATAVLVTRALERRLGEVPH